MHKLVGLVLKKHICELVANTANKHEPEHDKLKWLCINALHDMHHVQTAYVLMIAALIDKVRVRTSKYMCGWIYVCLNTLCGRSRENTEECPEEHCNMYIGQIAG